MSNRKRVMISYFELMAEKDSINTVLLDKKDKTDILIRAIQNYIDDYKLSGQAYSASKTYFENIHLSMLEIFKECCDSLYKSNLQIGADYSKYVDFFDNNTRYTDTDYHEEEIAKCNEQIATLKSERDSIQYQYYTNPLDGTVAVSSASIDAINAQINALENSIDLSNRWINKLHTFNDTATSSYEENCLAISAVKINQFKLLATHLTESLKDRSTKNLFDASHWAIDEKILREEIETKINNWILTSDNGIDWEKASDIYFHGSACSKDILAKLIIDKYGIDESQQNEWSLDSLLLYVAVLDPDVINIYFSNMTEVDRSGQIEGIINYQFDFKKIGDALQGNVDSVSMLEESMLIAAFASMDDGGRERFMEQAYSFEAFEKIELAPYSLTEAYNDAYTEEITVYIKLSPVFEKMKEHYGEIIITENNYEICSSGNETKDDIARLKYQNIRSAYQDYNLMSAFCMKDDMVVAYREAHDCYSHNVAINISIKDSSVSDDPLDKVISLSVCDNGSIKAFGGEDLHVVAYKNNLNEVSKIYFEVNATPKWEKYGSIVLQEAVSNLPKVGTPISLSKDLFDIVQIASGKDSETQMININNYVDALGSYGYESQAIISDKGKMIFTTSYVNEETFNESINWWINNEYDIEIDDAVSLLHDEEGAQKLEQYIHSVYFK